MNKHIANVGYLREVGLQDQRWKKVGRLFYDKDAHTAAVYLYGWRQGLCIAKPFSTDEVPFLRGELEFPIGTKEVDGRPEIVNMFCGHISTNVPDSWEDTVHYALVMEAMPICGKFVPGVWINVRLDDK